MNEEELFRDFPGRAERLRGIPRFTLYAVMRYRSNLLSHVRHVAWIVREIAPHAATVFPDFDPGRAEVLALVHDDAELITGDVQLGNKLRMSPAELRAVGEFEELAIEVLTGRYPERVGEYSYRELLLDAYEPQSTEAYVVKYADKFDALGEALHEVFGGNEIFVTNVHNEYGRIPTPLEFYRVYFSELALQKPALAALLEIDDPLFHPLPELDEREVAGRTGPHTEASFRAPTGYAPYDLWKQIIIKHGDPSEIASLVTRREDYRIEPA